MTALLSVSHLTTVFDLPGGPVAAVDDVSFEIRAGETLGLVGESGSGKSVTALSIVRLVQPPGRIAGGTIRFRDRDLLTLSEPEMREVRGAEIALIFQEPMTALNPVFTVGDQIAEALLVHKRASRREAKVRAVELLNAVGVPDAANRVRDYPHQLSGGMRQRVLIAAALACKPSLLIADEPTTALDVTIQAQILDLLREMKAAFNLSLLLITHDLGIVAETADRVAVMYAGRVVEEGLGPRHLSRSEASVYARAAGVARRRPSPASGCGPSKARCRCSARCRRAAPSIRAALTDSSPAPTRRRPRYAVGPDHNARCYLHDPATVRRAAIDVVTSITVTSPASAGRRRSLMPLVEVSHLVKHFVRDRGLFRAGTLVKAVDDVGFQIEEGETFGLVGESGSGKTTTGRCILRLVDATSGRRALPRRGRAGGDAGTHAPVAARHADRVSGSLLVAQPADARAADRRRAVGDPQARRPRRAPRPGRGSVPSRRAESRRSSSAIPTSSAAGSASASVWPAPSRCNPSLVVLDEPVSALDVSVQAQVVNLLMDLQQQLKLTYLFIAHDLRLVERICNRVAVMYLGKIVEMAPTASLFSSPRHPYTRALLSAVPVADPDAPRQRLVLDPATVDRDAALREVAAGHMAAI